MSHPTVLSVEQLSVNYDKTPVLWDINFSIPQAKLVGVIGPNGAGKSTLLKAMIGLVEPLTGKVEFFGLPFREARRRVAYVPQRTSVDWDFPITVVDVVLMGRYGRLGPLKWPSSADKEAAREALRMVGMEAFAHRQISQLSGGQQQRVFIARALVQEADLYFFDEPFAGIDVATEKAIVILMEQLKSQGKTLLIVHHDLSTVKRYFDWVILLNTCLVSCGPVTAVFTTDNIAQTYGKGSNLIEDTAKFR